MTSADSATTPAIDRPGAWMQGVVSGGTVWAVALRTLATIAVILGLWALVAETVFASSGVVPAPWTVFDRTFEDGWSFWSTNTWATARPALVGYLYGNLLGIAVALLVVLVPRIERGVLRIAVAVYCLPIIAIGPILVILMTGDGPAVVLAALSCFFTTVIGTMLGLKSADQTSLDLVTAYGGGKLEQLRRVQVRAALPGLLAALRIAAPLAVLGSMVAEYLGAAEGLGVAMLAASRTAQPEQVWAIAIVAAAVAGLGYAVVSLVARAVIRWPVPSVALGAATQRILRSGAQRSLAMRIGLSVLGLLASLAVLVALWALALEIGNLDPFIAKSPSEVWQYLFDEPTSGASRQALMDAFAVTIGHAATGFAVGLAVGVAIAITFVMSRSVETAVLPVAIALQSFPVIAMVPLIAVVVGRNYAAAAVVCGLVTFFPTLVYVSVALRGTPPAVLDLFEAYGASRGTSLRRAMLPTALPAVFASARLAAPGALFGALLAEWLVTGDGLGYAMLKAASTSEYTTVWAATAVITITSIAFYGLIAAVERYVGDVVSGHRNLAFAR